MKYRIGEVVLSACLLLGVSAEISAGEKPREILTGKKLVLMNRLKSSGLSPDEEVLHLVELAEALIQEGSFALAKPLVQRGIGLVEANSETLSDAREVFESLQTQIQDGQNRRAEAQRALLALLPNVEASPQAPPVPSEPPLIEVPPPPTHQISKAEAQRRELEMMRSFLAAPSPSTQEPKVLTSDPATPPSSQASGGESSEAPPPIEAAPVPEETRPPASAAVPSSEAKPDPKPQPAPAPKATSAPKPAPAREPARPKSWRDTFESLRRQGKNDEAQVHLEAALRASPAAPERAQIHFLLGQTQLIQGKKDQALESYLKSELDWSRSSDTRSSDFAKLQNNLGNLFLERKAYDRAEAAFWVALDVREQVFGKEDPSVAQVLTNLAYVYANSDREIQARPLNSRAMEILTATYGENHPLLQWPLAVEGFLLKEEGRVEAARQVLERAVAIGTAHGVNEPSVFRVYADLLESLGEGRAASQYRRRAEGS